MHKSKLWLAAVLLLTVMLFNGTASSTAQTTWPSQWPKYRLNQNNNAVWTSSAASGARWKTHVGAIFFTTASVVDGVVYIGTQDNKVMALDASSGKLLWTTAVNNWIMSDIIVADGKVFAGSGDRNFKRDYIDDNVEKQTLVRGQGDNSMYALDAKTGKAIWEYRTVGENMPTMVYKDGTLYFANGDRHFYALNANDGSLLWKLGMASYFSMSSLNLVGDIAYIGGADPNYFYAVDLKNHELVWASDTSNVEVGGIDDCSAAYEDGMLFTNSVTSLSDDGGFGGHGSYAINAASGKFTWAFDEGSGPMVEDNKCGVPVVQSGVVYMGSPVTQAFYALDAKSGKQLWKFGGTGVIKGAPVLYNGVVYFTNVRGILYAVDAQSGKQIAKRDLGGRVSPNGPVLVNGSLYIGTQAGDMYAIPISDLR